MMTKKRSAEKTVRDIRRATRRHYSAEEKIRIVLEGLRGEAIALPNYVDEKVLTAIFITVGRRSFWKPVKNGYLVTLHGKLPLMK